MGIIKRVLIAELVLICATTMLAEATEFDRIQIAQGAASVNSLSQNQMPPAPPLPGQINSQHPLHPPPADRTNVLAYRDFLNRVGSSAVLQKDSQDGLVAAQFALIGSAVPNAVTVNANNIIVSIASVQDGRSSDGSYCVKYSAVTGGQSFNYAVCFAPDGKMSFLFH